MDFLLLGDDNDEEEEKPPRRLTTFDGWPRRNDVDLLSMDVADGVLVVVVVDGTADRSDAVDNVVESPTNCWCLVVGDVCCWRSCCCDLMV